MGINQSVCPWQAGSILSAPIRKLFHKPLRILSPYLDKGMTAMDIGCGMGFFTLPMAEIVGANGNVIAVDMQQGMLEGLKKNLEKANRSNVVLAQCERDSLRIGKLGGTVDFALIFYMLHEVPDPDRLIGELRAALSPKGKILFVEPKLHVSGATFQKSMKMMKEFGLEVIETPKIPVSRSALLAVSGGA